MFTIQTEMGEIKPTETEILQLGRGYRSTLIYHFGISRITEA